MDVLIILCHYEDYDCAFKGRSHLAEGDGHLWFHRQGNLRQSFLRCRLRLKLEPSVTSVKFRSLNSTVALLKVRPMASLPYPITIVQGETLQQQ